MRTGKSACAPNQLGRSVTDFRSAPQEFGRPFFDETADAFSRVFRGLQPALLLLQLSRCYVRAFEHGFAGIGEGRRDRERSLFADQGCDFDRALAFTSGRDNFLDEPQPQGGFGVELVTGQELLQGVA